MAHYLLLKMGQITAKLVHLNIIFATMHLNAVLMLEHYNLVILRKKGNIACLVFAQQN
jgi:hypothetical protein